MTIRSITLSGFRGVVHPLTLSLFKNGKPTSLMLFGRNGTGKSSITDGWEWFHSGTIQHLAREGAKASAYPSRLPGGAAAPVGYVEVEFHDPAAGTVRLSLGGASSNAAGLAWFRERTTHPCHIRFEDLNRFVYLTKAERFDALADLMGFAQQVELQKQLRRVEKLLAERLATSRREQATAAANVTAHFKLPPDEPPTAPAVLGRLAGLFARHELPGAVTWTDVSERQAELTARVQHDARAKELKDVEALKRCLQRLEVPELGSAVHTYATALEAFHTEERATVADMLIGLYERGEMAVVGQRHAAPDAEDSCPLCGQAYDGDLLTHIRGELHALGEVRAARDTAERARAGAHALLPSAKDTLTDALARGVADSGATADQFPVASLRSRCEDLDRLITALRSDLASQVEALTEEGALRIAGAAVVLTAAADDAKAEQEALLALVTARVHALSDDGERAKLVADQSKVVRGLELWDTFSDASRFVSALAYCHEKYRALTERYVGMNVDDVEARFAAISSDVDLYFGILEAHTDGVSHPALRLLRDQDRAVVLEVEFQGDRVSPAYSYLSESQLNSFGLAVFLASVRHVNRDFRVVVLDDVVNSFDAYKRPQMIKLLKQEFTDFQVVVLTHDDVWWTELIDQCPQWARAKIKRYEPGIGPVVDVAKSEREMVEAYLADDEPTQAARTLGPMLERKLQALCEAMQVSVTYNTRNEYTLRPLLQSLVARAKKELGEHHPLHIAAKALEENTTFRNFSAHWKNPASGLTTPEVREVLGQWITVEGLVRCAQPTCGTLTGWRSELKEFACGCGTTMLVKTPPLKP